MTKKMAKHVNALLRKYRDSLMRIDHFAEFVDEYNGDEHSCQLEGQLNALEEAKNTFEETRDKLLADDEQDAEALNVDYKEYCKKYQRVKGFIASQQRCESSSIPAASSTLASHSASFHPPLRLPVIDLPSFDGDITKWLTFKDRFMSMVHEAAEVPEVTKLQYLLSSLKGDAAIQFDHTQLVADNYEPTWQSLLTRYDDTKTIKREYFKALYYLEAMNDSSGEELARIVNEVKRLVRGMQRLKEPVDTWDTPLTSLVMFKLDATSLMAWEQASSDVKNDSYKGLIEFCERRIKILNSSKLYNARSIDTKPAKVNTTPRGFIKEMPIQKREKTMAYVEQYTPGKTVLECPLCKEEHGLFKCNRFENMALEQRLKVVRDQRVCYNCLKRGHSVRQCRSTFRCFHCKKRHHTMVCSRSVEPSSPLQPVINATMHVKHTEKRKTIWLSTAQVILVGADGKEFPARSLLDMGAQSNFITERLAQQLGLKKQRVFKSLSGVGAMGLTASSMVSTTVKSKASSFCAVLDFIVLKRVTADVPARSVNIAGWNIPSEIFLADPAFHKSERVDILIGAELFADLLEQGQIKLAPHLPSLLKTKFGWIVSGSMYDESVNSSSMCHLLQDDTLNDLVKQMVDGEDIPEEEQLSEESVICEQFYVNTTVRNEEGRYIVQLLKVPQYEEQLGDSRAVAMRRFASLERRFKSDAGLKESYADFIEEYIRLGHMTKVATYSEGSADALKAGYYLPHHAVWKVESATTKCRVVFVASCKTTSGRSLNDVLLTGPTIQEDMVTILLRFRMKRVAFVADVAKMYRQVLVAKEDRHLQRILWREDSEKPVSIYELNTVTYGTACAPFLAIRTLQQVFSDHSRQFPKAAQCKGDFYVDDLVSGADTTEEANDMASQLHGLMSKGGFNLRKWASNHADALEGIPQEFHSEAMKEEISMSILGLWWTPTTDSVRLNIKMPDTESSFTGKQVLSCIARMMYDPMGFMEPVKMKAKMLMQRVWTYKENQGSSWSWNSVLPDDMECEWRCFYSDLHMLNSISIPRPVIERPDEDIQLHIFCDASEKGYGACCYIRSTSWSETAIARLVIAKSKVAPLSRKLTISRLELCGALLASKLYQVVYKAMGRDTPCYMWTDSMTTWYWINSPHKKWKPFVANRTSKIQTKTASCVWRHIPGTDNPADIVSRGCDPKTLIGARQWWAGPSWLCFPLDMWPTTPISKMVETNEERATALLVSSPAEETFSDLLFERYSSYTKLRKCVGYWLRYLNILRGRRTAAPPLERSTTSGLTTEELMEADKALCRLAQRDQFAEELKKLSSKEIVSKTSVIRFFTPYLDEDGLIRVNGRLNKSKLNIDVKHPVLIPKNHKLAKLLVQHYHLRLLHAGPQLMIASLRQRYWIMGIRSMARKVYHECLRCFRMKPTYYNQPMGDLPTSRVTEARPFAVSGVDYAGPVYVKATHRRAVPTKAFVAVFVCFVTHAVHLELVSDLSTAAFIAALRRFVARRGLVSELHSDNGTNFKGAANELHKVYELLQTDDHKSAINTWSADIGIRWKFIPPRAPHFGGLWEAAVRSMKFHLQRVLGTSAATFEDTVTLLVEIESCLNSRPITEMSNDPSDFHALTPGHFLTGSHLQTVADVDLTDVPDNRLNHWRVVQKRLQHFWARWKTEYLQQLHARSKWIGKKKLIKPGLLVVLREDNVPPLKWLLGRITEVHPGNDGVVRVVTVKTAQAKELKRAVAKISILPRQ